MIPLGQLGAGTLLDGDEAGGPRRGRRHRHVARRARPARPAPRALPPSSAPRAAAHRRRRLRRLRLGQESVDLILGALQFPTEPLPLFVALLDYRLQWKKWETWDRISQGKSGDNSINLLANNVFNMLKHL